MYYIWIWFYYGESPWLPRRHRREENSLTLTRFSSNCIDIFSCFLQVIGVVLIIFNPFKFSRKRVRECDWLKVMSFIFTKTLPPMECTTHITGLLPTPAFRNLRLISSLRYIKDRLTRECHKAYDELSI